MDTVDSQAFYGLHGSLKQTIICKRDYAKDISTLGLTDP